MPLKERREAGTRDPSLSLVDPWKQPLGLPHKKGTELQGRLVAVEINNILEY